MSEETEILFERRGAIGLVTLNRPRALNALTHAMCLAMDAQLQEWERDAAVAAVVIRGTGEKAFCAGGDIRALYESGKAGTSYAIDFYRDEYRLNARIKHYPKPYIALLHGIVMGGGFGLSVHGSHRVAAENVVFAMPETGIGLFPDVGGSFALPRCPGELGMYFALTGARVKTADVIYAQVATHHVPAEHFEALTERLASGQTPDTAIGALAKDPGTPTLEGLRGPIDRHFAGDSVEEILAALDATGSEWSRETAAIIRTKSPTSSKVAFRQLREGRKLSFDDCMRMEFRMVHGIIAGHDFYEGVRAAIVEKDNKPVWNPADLSQVSVEDVDGYFAPLRGGELVL